MKKSIAFTVLAGTLSLSLIGCGQPSDSSTNTDQQTKKDNNQTQQKQQKNSTDHSSDSNQTKSSQNQNKSKSDNTGKTGQSASNNKVKVDKNPDSTLVLVNKTHKLPDGYIPPNLVVPDVPFAYHVNSPIEKMHMQKPAAVALEQLFNQAKKDGIILYAQSGYRSYKRQKVIFASNVEKMGEAKASVISAHPGTSEHQTGLAMDLSSADVGDQLIQDFGETKEGKWVAAHAAQFGFIVRYPKGKQSVTGYEYEPWHLRYVGVKAAKYIHDHNITLEAYISQNG